MSAKEEETLEQGLAGETTPLLGGEGKGEGRSPDVPATATATTTSASPSQLKVWEFLEAQTQAGAIYEGFMVVLILANVVSVILGSLFAEPYNATLGYSWALRDSPDALCGSTCDALWFGNYSEGNPLSVLGLGATSLLELVTIAVFTIEYGLRVWTSSPLEGYSSPLAYVLTDFFSWVDLAATLPFYVDAFVLRDRKTALGTTGFVRMFRLFRMMRVEGGRYDSALGLCGAVYRAQKAVLGTAAFVGATTWISVSSLYYLVERENPSMIYCRAGLCSELNADLNGSVDGNVDGNVDTSLCTMDEWGLVDCANAGCPSTEDVPEPCYNLFQSIPMASYYALLNLFGEFPLFDQHSVGGQVVGTLTAVVAVTVFALPVGIIGNGFESEIERRRQRQRQTESDRPIVERGVTTPGYVPPAAGSGWLRDAYLFFFSTSSSASASRASVFFDYFVDALIIGTALTFAIDTIDDLPDGVRLCQSWFEFFAVVVFTVEYVSRFYVAIRVDPLYNSNNNGDNNGDNDASLQGKMWSYATGFVPLVDLLGFLPYWIALLFGGTIVDASGPSGPFDTFVKALRLLRIFHFEKYTHAFTSFDDIFSRNYDVLAITFFSSILLWVFFGALLYMTERDNPDPEMAVNYNSIPNSMWMTLLNLSGEAPLAQYSLVGKIATGFLGLFATAIFGIPIGVLGGGFEAVVEDETNDDDRETAEAEAQEAADPSGASSASSSSSQSPETFGTDLERICYDLVNGQGSEAAKTIETLIYVLIFVAIGIGAWQTVDGHEDDFSHFEAFTVFAFTLEYLVRLVGVGADPVFAGTDDACPIRSRLRYLMSFYSIIDLLAILPYYLALALPDSTVDEYDEYLRMARICRLLKLDKYIPSFTLIDDVIRYKWDSLKVAGYAAITLWTIFAGLIYLFEYTDSANAIDPVPLYAKCGEDCSMMDRFRNYFDGFYYTGIHLTGDYPITTYCWPGRFVNFFMVVAAVGVVSIPSGLIANGFVDIVQSKHMAEKKKKKKDLLLNNNNKEVFAPAAADSEAVEGDDWYEVQYRALEGVAPPTSTWGPTVDQWQCDVNAFLNGTKDARGHTCHTRFGFAGRVFIFSVIIANIVAVMVESVPWIDKAVGDQPGNAFDVFERFSIFVFTLEYLARLFCAAKNRESLYSSKVYAYTFFGIVDLLSTAPWYIEQILVATGTMSAGGDIGKVFRIFRIVRLLQLEDFITAFSKLDNVFRASADILKSCFLLALIIWIGGGSLFFIFEQNNPNFRQCDDSIPPFTEYNNDTEMVVPGCFDFPSTAACAAYYGLGMCEQTVFVNLPNTLYMTAVFLGGEWGVTDFTWPGRILCILFCYVGIALYAIPAGTFFDKFGSILGLDGEDDGDDDDEEEEK